MYISRIGILNERTFPLSGLQSYWRLNETTGTNAADSKGNYAGTHSNVTCDSGGKNGYCGLYNSTTSYTSMGNVYNFDRTDTYSISCWAKRVGINAIDMIHTKQSNTNPWNGYCLYYRADNKLEFGLISNGSGNITVISNSALTSTTIWQHIVTTFNGSSKASGATIYVNSISQGLTTVSDNLTGTIQTTQNFLIGNRATAYGVDARIDDFGVWNRVLSQAEVRAIYNLGTGIFY